MILVDIPLANCYYFFGSLIQRIASLYRAQYHRMPYSLKGRNVLITGGSR
jgi:hypothetical protein